MLVKAVPMMHTDESRPSDFTFANPVGIQTDDSEDEYQHDVPAELRRTITSHLRLTNLEVPAAITPTMLLQPSFPRTSTSRWARPHD